MVLLNEASVKWAMDEEEQYAALFSKIQHPMEGVLLYCDLRSSLDDAKTLVGVKDNGFRIKSYWGFERFRFKVEDHEQRIENEHGNLERLTDFLENAMSNNFFRNPRYGSYALVRCGDNIRAGLVTKCDGDSVELMSSPRSSSLMKTSKKNVVCSLLVDKIGSLEVDLPACVGLKGFWAVGFPRFYYVPGNTVTMFKNISATGFLGEFRGRYSSSCLVPAMKPRCVEQGPYR